jgi:A/G-specific adenine glycosylase
MLQQTTTPHAAPYFLAFTARWPTVQALAAAPDSEVMSAWAGLGYYARARNLLACARAVATRHDGVFPDEEAKLLELPGIGAYTAAAVAAIAFDQPANVVDGNVERVVARLNAVERPLPGAKTQIKALAADLVGPERSGDWAQALMDLGAGVCLPKAPLCGRCPIGASCQGQASGDPARFPVKGAKPDRPRRHGVAYLGLAEGEVALVRRPDRGLLGGMLALPTTEWRAEAQDWAQVLSAAPAEADWRRRGAIEHVFTHFSLTLEIVTAELERRMEGYVWTPVETAGAGLPSVFRKALIVGLGLAGGGGGRP